MSIDFDLFTRRNLCHNVLAIAVNLVMASAACADTVDVEFSPDGWKINDWIVLKPGHHDHVGRWLQEENHLVNEVPEEATPEELIGPRSKETHAAMVYHQPFEGHLDVRCRMSFDERMAPSILLVEDLTESPSSRAEYRNHWQIVLFDEGVNIWHGKFNNGRFRFSKVAYARFKVLPKKTYDLQLKRRGNVLEVAVDQKHRFGLTWPDLPAQLHVGILAGEGRNRFYSMTVASGADAPK